MADSLKLEKPVSGVFQHIKPPFSVQLARSSYLGNGYWKGIDLSENTQFQNMNSLQVGAGNTAIKMDSEQGQWWGGNKFEEARSRMDMNGNYIFRDSQGFDRILIGEK